MSKATLTVIMPRKKQKIEIETDPASGQTFLSEWLDNENDGQLLLDVYQDDKNIYITSTIAGVEPKDLEIFINHDLLTIRGQRSHEMNQETYEYFYQECYWGNFSRSIILPVEVDQEKISATLKNGVLTITLPKSKRRRNVPITVNPE